MPKKMRIKPGSVAKNVPLRITISNDHFEALKWMEEQSGVRVPALGAAAFQAGLAQVQKRFAIDAETN